MKIRGPGVQELNFYMLLKEYRHQFKLDCYKYEILTAIQIITNKISLKYTEKE
jgi:hypothetical protein